MICDEPYPPSIRTYEKLGIKMKCQHLGDYHHYTGYVRVDETKALFNTPNKELILHIKWKGPGNIPEFNHLIPENTSPMPCCGKTFEECKTYELERLSKFETLEDVD